MKKQTREKLLKRRDSIPTEIKNKKERAIEKRLFALDAFHSAQGILMYVSFRSEVDTRRFLDDIIKLDKTLILPAVDAIHNVLKLYEVKDTANLLPGYMGILEPGKDLNRQVTLDEIDLVVIPGTGFDPKGNRLGYGGGYYDRLLSLESKQLAKVKHIPTVALAFEEQIAKEIPAEPHDIGVDMIITDKRLIQC